MPVRVSAGREEPAVLSAEDVGRTARGAFEVRILVGELRVAAVYEVAHPDRLNDVAGWRAEGVIQCRRSDDRAGRTGDRNRVNAGCVGQRIAAALLIADVHGILAGIPL